jgi:hypothetical protein
MKLSHLSLLSLSGAIALASLTAACGDKKSDKTEATAEAEDEEEGEDEGKKKKKKGKKDKDEKAAATATAAASGSASAAAAVPPPPSPLPPVELNEPKALSFGGKEVKAEICKLDTGAPTMASDSFDKAIRGVAAGPGGLVYVLDHAGNLRRYKASSGGACELSLDKGFGQGGVLTLDSDPKQADYFDTLAIDDKGDVYVSGFIAKAKKVSNGSVTELCKQSGRLYVDPSTGAGYLRNDKVDLSSCSATPVGLDLGKDVRSDMIVGYGSDTAVVYNVKEKDKNVYKVGLFSGKTKKWAVGDADGDGQMCNVGAVAPCALGLCVVDANCRSLKVVDKGGKLVGAGKINDLIGLSYPWPRGISVTKNGAYMAATHSGKEKGDKFSYGMVFRLTGL